MANPLSLFAESGRVTSMSDAETDRLRSTLELMQREEDSYVERYSRRRCSVEDVIRAKALRLEAEIKLIRHQKRFKSWAEVCAEYHLCQR